MDTWTNRKHKVRHRYTTDQETILIILFEYFCSYGQYVNAGWLNFPDSLVNISRLLTI